MDRIRQALERARTLKGGTSTDSATLSEPQSPSDRTFDFPDRPTGQNAVALDWSHLESRRIIAHDDTDPRARSFDMLRTQVLQAMDSKNWKLLGVTSPTPGCGKTVTAINLAFSIARQPERPVLLVDLDLHKPQLANCLGLNRDASGLCEVLEGTATLSETVVVGQARSSRISVLPAQRATSDSSALIGSRAMVTLLRDIKRDYQSSVVIFDLPPMLAGDDVLAILPQLDCGLLVAAAGKTTHAEIEECNRHLQSTEILRLVLNKATERSSKYYYYYSRPRTP